MTISESKQLTTTDGWIDISGQIVKVGEIKQRTKSQMSKSPGQQYNVQKIEIADQTDKIGVWAYANQQFLPGQNVTVHGMLKEYNNVRYIDFADVKQANATVNIPQSAPPQSPQGSQPVAGPPKCDDMVRIRSDALAYAKDLVVADKIIQAGLQTAANEFTAFIQTGQWFNQPKKWPEPSGVDGPQDIDEPPITDLDVPNF